MLPRSSDGPKPALTVALRNVAAALDAFRLLIEHDALYATPAAYDQLEAAETAWTKVHMATLVAIDRQLEERAR